jgi:hypothetical protein
MSDDEAATLQLVLTLLRNLLAIPDSVVGGGEREEGLMRRLAESARGRAALAAAATGAGDHEATVRMAHAVTHE